jgi:hypothetical protein
MTSRETAMLGKMAFKKMISEVATALDTLSCQEEVKRNDGGYVEGLAVP